MKDHVLAMLRDTSFGHRVNGNCVVFWNDPAELVAAVKTLPDYKDDWPIVQKLSAHQVAKLENHRHDRGLDGWMNEEPHWLLQRLREEVEELAANPSWEEAADVAKFAAMFAALAGRVVVPTEGTPE